MLLLQLNLLPISVNEHDYTYDYYYNEAKITVLLITATTTATTTALTHLILTTNSHPRLRLPPASTLTTSQFTTSTGYTHVDEINYICNLTLAVLLMLSFFQLRSLSLMLSRIF